jgi:hypothetical protein
LRLVLTTRERLILPRRCFPSWVALPQPLFPR